MEAQSQPRLTDQAQVAVALARALTGLDERSYGRAASVAHLIAGLAGEPEGLAGILLRQSAGEVAARIATHPAVNARSLPSVDIAFVALPVQDRPVWTLELLRAAARVGGEDLAFILEECSVQLNTIDTDLDRLMPRPETVEEESFGPETFGQGSLRASGYTPDADRAVAITRAAEGNSRSLLGWLYPDPETASILRNAPAVPLQAVLELRAARGGPTTMADLITAITHLSIQASL